jgi:macrolide transport system ATP-binding/permease protein
VETLFADLRYAIRMLAKRPAFTLVALLSLALGIGANTTIFSVVNALLLRSLPVTDPARLVTIYTRDAQNPAMLSGALSHLNWKDYREQARSFSGILGYDWSGMSVATGGEASLMVGQLVSENYFDLLGVRPERGRAFTAEEGTKPGGHPVAVVSHRFWQQRLGGDPAAVGRTILINRSPFTVIGVAPERFTGTDTGVQPELWLPMSMNRQIKADPEQNWYEQRRGLFVNTIARLRPGVTVAGAQAEMTSLAHRLERDYPNDNKGRTAVLVPLTQATVPPEARQGLVVASMLLLGVVGLVLLIACANVANLLLARATARRREIAIRLSQGASRGRLVRQLLTESLLLASIGGGLGLLLMLWASHALLVFLPTLPFPITVSLDLGIDVRVLAFALAITLVTGFLFGLVPALQSSRPQLVTALKSQAGAAPPAGHGMGLRGALVAGQVALSLLALIAAALFLRSLGAAQRMDPGYDTAHLLSVSFDVGLYGLDRGRGEQLFRAVREQVGALPGVAAVSLGQSGPLQGAFMRSVFLEGAETTTSNGLLVEVNAVDPAYMRTVGVPIVAGRGLTDADRAGTQPVVVVNRTMAEKFWPRQSALGKRFHFHSQPAVEVVGVARDAKYNGVAEDPQPYVYEPLAQNYVGGVTLVARTARDPLSVLPSIQRQVRTLAPGIPLVGAATLAQQLDASLWAPRFAASMLALFGALALALATAGIYGVMSFSVAQRSRDIGVRMALGAGRASVLQMILGQGMRLVAVGLVIGMGLSLAVSRLAGSLLIGVGPTDPVAFLATPPILALAALFSIYIPARRATAVDPTVILRYD